MSHSPMLRETEDAWPELPWRDWAPTVSTLHMWLQIVGKVRMALAPPRNHWWHIPLYVTSRGLTTSPIPYHRRSFQVDFDFLDHRLDVTDTDGRSFTMPLVPRSVARFYREFMAALDGLGIDVRISTKPVEVADAIPFDSDEEHASYDPSHAHLLWRGFLQADRVMKEFQVGFVGKASPVHLFWGSFDLAATRYSGRTAPLHLGGVPNCPTWVMEEAYAREESSIGWWPSSEPPGPAFYAYTYPEPEGFRAAAIRTEGAFFDQRYGELMLPWDVVRQAPDPAVAVLEFFQEAYEIGADLAGWDRSMLEPVIRPDRPPTQPWTTDPTTGAGHASRSAASPSNHRNIKNGGPTSQKRLKP